MPQGAISFCQISCPTSPFDSPDCYVYESEEAGVQTLLQLNAIEHNEVNSGYCLNSCNS